MVPRPRTPRPRTPRPRTPRPRAPRPRAPRPRAPRPRTPQRTARPTGSRWRHGHRPRSRPPRCRPIRQAPALRRIRDIIDNELKVTPADHGTEVDAFLRQQLADAQDDLAKARVRAATLHDQQSRGLVSSLASASADAEVQSLVDRERK